MKTRKLCNEGKYVKFLDLKGDDILSFKADNGDDNYFRILKKIQEKHTDYDAYQCCEEKEEFNNFKKIYFAKYNYYGELQEGLFLEFDFENNKVIAGDRKYKVKTDTEFTYKIQKTQIKAIDGIQGFYNFIVKSMNVGDVFHNRAYGIIKKHLYRIEE